MCSPSLYGGVVWVQYDGIEGGESTGHGGAVERNRH